MDNVFIERLWWSLKYECIYINEFLNGKTLRKSAHSGQKPEPL
jgi:putative transposase